MALAIAILLAATGIGYAISRLAKVRKEMPEFAERAKKPPRQSKQQKRLEQIRAAEPKYVPPSIDDLVAEEIADIGIDKVPGAEGLAPAVLLKVYRRDTPATEDCPPEQRRFVLTQGVDAASAGVDDVRLICDAHPTASRVPVTDPDREKEPDPAAD